MAPPFTMKNHFDTSEGFTITRASIYTGVDMGLSVVTSGASLFVQR